VFSLGVFDLSAIPSTPLPLNLAELSLTVADYFFSGCLPDDGAGIGFGGAGRSLI
jgi:hypothetical protein